MLPLNACKWPSASTAQCIVSKGDPVLRIWFRRVLLAERKHKRQSVALAALVLPLDD